jgi:hypothetical protein
MKKTLEEASKEAERIFHAGGPFAERCEEMIQMLRDLSNLWVSRGWVA